MLKKKKHPLADEITKATTQILADPHYHKGKAANFGRDVGAIIGLECVSAIEGDRVILTVCSPDHEDFEASYFWTEPRTPPASPVSKWKIGDLVQWEVDGVLRMEAPASITAIQEGYVMVQGSKTGIPESEIIKA